MIQKENYNTSTSKEESIELKEKIDYTYSGDEEGFDKAVVLYEKLSPKIDNEEEYTDELERMFETLLSATLNRSIAKRNLKKFSKDEAHLEEYKNLLSKILETLEEQDEYLDEGINERKIWKLNNKLAYLVIDLKRKAEEIEKRERIEKADQLAKDTMIGGTEEIIFPRNQETQTLPSDSIVESVKEHVKMKKFRLKALLKVDQGDNCLGYSQEQRDDISSTIIQLNELESSCEILLKADKISTEGSERVNNHIESNKKKRYYLKSKKEVDKKLEKLEERYSKDVVRSLAVKTVINDREQAISHINRIFESGAEEDSRELAIKMSSLLEEQDELILKEDLVGALELSKNKISRCLDEILDKYIEILKIQNKK